MAALNLRALNDRLIDEEEKGYWIHMVTSAELDKYPGE